MPPISATGQVIPQRPTPLDFTTFSYFDDFVYDTGTGNFPNDFSAGGMQLGNPAGIDPAHPGVAFGDISAAAKSFLYGQSSAAQGFNLNNFATWNLEWMWQLNQNPGVAGTDFTMGPSTANGAGQSSNMLSLFFNFPASTNVNLTNTNLWLVTDNGANHYADTGVNVTPLLGTWVKCNLIWSRATGFLRVLVNGVQALNTNANLPAGSLMPYFGFGTFLFGANTAGTRMLFDYFKITGTLVR